MTLTFLNNRHGVHPVPQAQGQELSPREKMIHRRAVEVAVWGMPLVGTRGLLNGTLRDLGGDWNDVVFFSKPMVSRHGFLTANNQTPYPGLSVFATSPPSIG